jgi:hypothetical protein
MLLLSVVYMALVPLLVLLLVSGIVLADTTLELGLTVVVGFLVTGFFAATFTGAGL